MGVIECPLCCAEVFPDICSLKNHLLDLSENIICPICEVQFPTIQSLASHLGQGCEKDIIKIALPEIPEIALPEIPEIALPEIPEIGQTIKFDINLQTKENGTPCNQVEDIPVVNDSKPELDLLRDSSSCINQINTIQGKEMENYNEQNVHVTYSDILYSCSVCNITFTSIEEHLNKFHHDENVIVDNETGVSILKGTGNTVTNQNQEDEISLSEVELLPKEASSVIWTAEQVNSLLIVNWNPNECFIENQKILLDNSNEINSISSFDNKAEKAHWILHGNYYHYCKDKNKFDISTKNIYNFKDCEEWPLFLQKYPIATFISVEENLFSDKDSCENKPYIFNNHRIRLLRVMGKDGIPNLEDIPFFEEPPDSLMPVFEQVADAPEDLAGAYSIMWPCYICGALTYHWTDLVKHNCSTSTKYFPCTMCKETFQSRRNLNTHFSVIHKVLSAKSGRFSCPTCLAKVQTAAHLERHLAMHKKNELIKCNLCNSLVLKSAYSVHKKGHEKNGALSLVCQNCNRAFKGEIELNLHIPQCHLLMTEEDNLKCLECRETFTDLQTLREHMESHDIPIKQHLCSFCPKSYNRLIDKVIHERVHTKSKPHFCNECGKCFRLRNALVAHKRIHSGEKPFSCSSCDKKFRTEHLLRSHIAVHGGYHKLKCKYCNRMFRTKVKLEHHENFHKDPIVCTDCNRTFYSIKFSEKHKEKHKNNELIFTCNMCPNMFDKANYLESHLRTSHGLDTVTSISISSQKTFQDMEKSAAESFEV